MPVHVSNVHSFALETCKCDLQTIIHYSLKHLVFRDNARHTDNNISRETCDSRCPIWGSSIETNLAEIRRVVFTKGPVGLHWLTFNIETSKYQTTIRARMLLDVFNSAVSLYRGRFTTGSPQKTPHNSPDRPRYGVYFMNSSSDLYSTIVAAIIDEIPFYTETRYNGTRLYLTQLNDWMLCNSKVMLYGWCSCPSG